MNIPNGFTSVQLCHREYPGTEEYSSWGKRMAFGAIWVDFRS
jgi:hypothetical protein